MAGGGRGDAAEQDARSIEESILFQLALRGRVSATQLADASEAAQADVESALREMASRGLVARADASTPVAPTAAGRERAQAIVARERERLGDAVRALDLDFTALNARLKEILLRWQVRRDGPVEKPNDHRDPGYDALVLDDLRALHGDAERSVLAALAALRPRYRSLRERLRAALERATRGERAAVAGVVADSFHAAWWELHADLLAILGRARGDADA